MENLPFVKSPAFQIYPADFLADKNTLVMTAAEVGAYWLLLCVCWRENGLPEDVEELADLARTPVKQFQVSWEKRLKRCFIQRQDGRWTHNRLEKERVKQFENREKRQTAGEKGAKRRWQKDGNAKAKPSPKPDERDSNAIAKDSLSSSSSTTSSISTSTLKEKEKRDRPAKPQDERRNHPAIVAFFEVKGKYPTKELWNLIIDKVGTHPEVLKMRECWVTWRSHDYNPEDMGWLLDWYFNGIPEHRQIGRSNGTNQQRTRSAAERNAEQLERNIALVRDLRSASG